jgi:hypothetical protein
VTGAVFARRNQSRNTSGTPGPLRRVQQRGEHRRARLLIHHNLARDLMSLGSERPGGPPPSVPAERQEPGADQLRDDGVEIR